MNEDNKTIRQQWRWRDYNVVDLVLLFTGLIAITVTSILFKSPWLIIVNSILGILCVFMQAKGKVATQFLGIAWVVFYCFLTYQQQYYGETILNAIIILPLYIYGAIHWLANRDKKDNVVIVRNNLSKKEWSIFISEFAGRYNMCFLPITSTKYSTTLAFNSCILYNVTCYLFAYAKK